jgi:hypothetical protein
MSGLSLESAADLAAGGKSGAVVIPGRPSESRLLSAVRHEGKIRMPPGRKLPDSEIGEIEKWIAAGAVWPTGAVGEPPKPNHWSFRSPGSTSPPEVRRKNWIASPIDQFILAGLEKAAVSPSPPAPTETLVKRVFLDITGLLPTPDEVAAFVTDRRSNAWERLVDRLLGSPHYGERWGRHWLDAARYAVRMEAAAMSPARSGATATG